VTNRGDDSIAVFALDADGVPTLLQHAPAGGASPRFCLLLERHRRMIVANERGQTVTVLAVDDDGLLAPTGVSLAVPGAACVLDLDPAR
jgi:6-phosphogluconolactonase (cycloisomerase 2 family)